MAKIMAALCNAVACMRWWDWKMRVLVDVSLFILFVSTGFLYAQVFPGTGIELSALNLAVIFAGNGISFEIRFAKMHFLIHCYEHLHARKRALDLRRRKILLVYSRLAALPPPQNEAAAAARRKYSRKLDAILKKAEIDMQEINIENSLLTANKLLYEKTGKVKWKNCV